MQGGRVCRSEVPRGLNGRGLCRWCSIEVPPRRFTFCSAYCVHEWRLRTQPGYLRDQVFQRDKGRCSGCGINTLIELRRLRRSRGARRLEMMAHWGLKAKLRKSLWDADHIIPVIEGGGECDLANIRTLCLRCHRVATVALRERIRRAKVLLDRANDSAGVSDCENVIRDTSSDNATSTYDRSRSDCDTRKNDRSGTNPHVGADGHWRAILLLPPERGIERMKWSQDLDARSELTVIADGDLADIQNRAVEVKKDSFAKLDI
jgi:5-methylcytosine-specific restriction enzyme A